MTIRKAKSTDAHDLKVLYFDYLTRFPPKEEQDMVLWQSLLDKFEKDENMYLLVAEEDEKVVSTVQMAIIENLTHNVRPFAVIENVVTHLEYRNRGLASALLERASESANATRSFWKLVQTEKARWISIERTVLPSMKSIPASSACNAALNRQKSRRMILRHHTAGFHFSESINLPESLPAPLQTPWPHKQPHAPAAHPHHWYRARCPRLHDWRRRYPL